MASRKLEDLHPDLKPLAEWFLEECAKHEFGVLVTCTYRSNAEQDALYAQGRTKPGRKVTNARGGQSKHNFTIGSKPASKALDIVVLRHGRPIWGTGGNGIDNDPTDDDKDDLELWQRVGGIGEAVGLEWGGLWKGTLRDFPHFQLAE